MKKIKQFLAIFHLSCQWWTHGVGYHVHFFTGVFPDRDDHTPVKNAKKKYLKTEKTGEIFHEIGLWWNRLKILRKFANLPDLFDIGTFELNESGRRDTGIAPSCAECIQTAGAQCLQDALIKFLKIFRARIFMSNKPNKYHSKHFWFKNFWNNFLVSMDAYFGFKTFAYCISSFLKVPSPI